MSRFRIARTAVVVSALVAAGLGAALPAGAEPGTNSGWAHREDGRAPGVDQTEIRSGEGLQLYSFNGQVTLTSQATSDKPARGIEFIPPTGQTLQAGVTYPVGGPFRKPSATAGQVITFRDGRMCDRTDSQLVLPYSSNPGTPTVGWFRVDQIERSGEHVIAFAATYEVNCQYVDGPLGFEGSIAFNATDPAGPIPDAPLVPGPIAGLKATTNGPDNGSVNKTTLSWTNPEGFADATVDMVQLCCDSFIPALVHSPATKQWRGQAASYTDTWVDSMDGRIYRVVARGPSGRIGTPAEVTVLGSRLKVPTWSRTIQIGQTIPIPGRLTKSSDLASPGFPTSGPPLPGRKLIMCRQDVINWIDNCNPVDSAISDADGRFTLTVSPKLNSYYAVVLPATGDLVGNWAYVLSTQVAPQTDLRVRSPSSREATVSIARGSAITFTTSRARRGSTGVVRLQHLVDGKWRTIVQRRLGTGTDRLVIRYREYRRGLNAYRILKLADSRHVNGHSRVQKIRVR